MRVYFIAMTIRIACVASLLFVRGWWILVVGLAAVVLPYFAVIFANERASAPGEHPEAPAPREITGGAPSASAAGSRGETLLVVDEPAERRSAESRPTETPVPSSGAAEDSRDEGAV